MPELGFDHWNSIVTSHVSIIKRYYRRTSTLAIRRIFREIWQFQVLVIFRSATETA